jgi:hypothetical protein
MGVVERHVYGRWAREGNLSIGQTRIGAVRLHAQYPCFNECIEHGSANHVLDAAEPLHLFNFQSQPRHFKVFGADAVEQPLMVRCAQRTLLKLHADRSARDTGSTCGTWLGTRRNGLERLSCA